MNQSVRWITRLALLMALSISFQMLRLPPPITGPFVNLMLLLTVMVLGIWGGVVLGVLTPVIAFLVGILGFPVMIPYIILGNAVFVLSFFLFRKQHPSFSMSFLGIIVGSFLKYGVFALALTFVGNLPPPAAKAFGVSQLLTALLGGMLALLLEKALKHTRFLKH